MEPLTIFALCRVPVVLGAFALALHHYRKRSVPLAPLPVLLLPLAGLLVTSAGDLCGNWFRGCFVFGASHLCWFAFLLRRGKFSWRTAGSLALVLAVLLALVVFPAVDSRHRIAFAWYAFCTTISVSASAGARKAPGGNFYLAGLTALMISDVCIGLSLAKVPGAAPMIAPLYVLSLFLLFAALVRGLPAPPPER